MIPSRSVDRDREIAHGAFGCVTSEIYEGDISSVCSVLSTKLDAYVTMKDHTLERTPRTPRLEIISRTCGVRYPSLSTDVPDSYSDP
jgi:hypothetical protein